MADQSSARAVRNEKAEQQGQPVLGLARRRCLGSGGFRQRGRGPNHTSAVVSRPGTALPPPTPSLASLQRWGTQTLWWHTLTGAQAGNRGETPHLWVLCRRRF